MENQLSYTGMAIYVDMVNHADNNIMLDICCAEDRVK